MSSIDSSKWVTRPQEDPESRVILDGNDLVKIEVPGDRSSGAVATDEDVTAGDSMMRGELDVGGGEPSQL